MKSVLATVVAALALLLVAPGAAEADVAQEPDAVQVAQAAKKAKKRKLKKFDFTGDDIDGTMVRPEGMGINVRGWATHASLVRIRQTFFNEVIRATEDID